MAIDECLCYIDIMMRPEETPTDIELLRHKPDDEADGLGVLRQYFVSETYHNHGHDFYELFFVIHGQALHDANGHSIVLDAGSLVLIRPGDVHCYRLFNSFAFDFINVSLDRRFFGDAMAYLELQTANFDTPQLPPHAHLAGYEYMETKRRLLCIWGMTPGSARRQAFRTLLPELLVYLHREEGDAAHPVLPAWFSALLNELDHPECFTAGAVNVWKHTNYSQEHLIRTFQRYLQMSPTAYINTKRLSYAAELLLGGELSPLAVCEKAGFNNLSHFYHLFKEQYGCAPGQFVARYAGRDAEPTPHQPEH